MSTESLPDELNYRLRTAAEHATMNVPIVSPGKLANEIRASLVGVQFDSLSQVVVCGADRRLVGIIRIEDLFAAQPETPAHVIMDSNTPLIVAGVHQEVAAWTVVQHGENSIAVVDSSGRFRGVIPPYRLLTILLEEHDEDVARLGGFLKGTASARRASEERVAARYWHRLPWLLIGLLGALAAAKIVDSFEEQLQKNILLSFFVPGVVYLADAVGTQTEAVVIRGLSIGVRMRSVLRPEALTGLLVGLSLAAAFFPVALVAWGDLSVVVSVSIALMSACSVATVMAMLLPWFLQRLGRDPAFGSGPLATVIQDLLSIIIFFTIATFVVD